MHAAHIPTIPRHDIAGAYRYCELLARSHYENFPVASRFLPKGKRPFLWSIYAFARTADDIADEGTLSAGDRLRRLDDWQARLDRCAAGDVDDPVFVALGDTLRRTAAPPELLTDLLTAFRMDVTVNRYRTFQNLLGYCRCSANPVGRLVLHLFDNATARTTALSDTICTALQLANFWQDVRVDWAKNRLYVPLEDCERFGYNADDIAGGHADAAFRRLLQFQVDRTSELFEEGKVLLAEATPRLRFELALIWHGGVAILGKIRKQNYDVLGRRPALTTADKLGILAKAVLERRS